MAQKCVHKGCGKTFDKPDESECIYHSGPPVFHEGQKGWKCCKPRVLTFDEFMNIPPCTKGQHSAVDDTPAPEPEPQDNAATAKPGSAPTEPAQPKPQASLPTRSAPAATPKPATTPAPVEDESDDPDTPIPQNASCKRRGCNATSTGSGDRSSETCVHHPGQALFHEGSKGWTCCKRRVLEFDEFLRIEGCKSKARHLSVGKKKDPSVEEVLQTVRHDFYQTPRSVIASLYLKKVDKESSRIVFRDARTIELDLKTTDAKRFTQDVPLYAGIDTEKSSYKVMGTKVEFNLVKVDGTSWPVFRGDEKVTGEIIQMGKAGRV